MSNKLPKVEVARGRWLDPDKLTRSQDAAATKILAEKGKALDEMGPLVRRLGSYDEPTARRMISRLPERVRRITEGVAVTDIYFAAPVPLAAVREDKRHVEALVDELDGDPREESTSGRGKDHYLRPGETSRHGLPYDAPSSA